ncbi:hypothetical protein P154DRAFT_612596 [Amniculicola lignicola CBS 123094]|uniref:Uncharacterized protein n=1 Tax=Amniculicola lignicola CBS 123094 TaxID=1392246 RepID=A0A6A5W3Y9_9PLEO|nr:hypothetical protein P154DRAFT_612596 [Amniculicola lignicola CBS 123094]
MTTAETKFSLLDLPPELRLKVYSHISPSLDCHPWHYQGLLLSCRQIQLEVEDEAVKSMVRYLKGVADAWDTIFTLPLGIKMPTSFANAKHVTASISMSILKSGVGAKFMEPLSPLARLHLSSLTLDFHSRDSEGDDFANLQPEDNMFAENLLAFLVDQTPLLEDNKQDWKYDTNVDQPYAAADCVQILYHNCNFFSRQALMFEMRGYISSCQHKTLSHWNTKTIVDARGESIGWKWTTLSGRIHDVRGRIKLP